MQCHSLSVNYMGKDVRDCVSQNVQCHLLAVGCMKRCDESFFHKSAMTNSLLIIGKDVMRLLFPKYAMSLTSC